MHFLQASEDAFGSFESCRHTSICSWAAKAHGGGGGGGERDRRQRGRSRGASSALPFRFERTASCGYASPYAKFSTHSTSTGFSLAQHFQSMQACATI